MSGHPLQPDIASNLLHTHGAGADCALLPARSRRNLGKIGDRLSFGLCFRLHYVGGFVSPVARKALRKFAHGPKFLLLLTDVVL